MKLNLNGVWDFYPDGDMDKTSIVVPTWWDSLKSTTGYPSAWETGLHHGVYERHFDLRENDFDEDVFVHIGALATLGKVFVNGVSVGPQSTKGYLMTLLPYDLNINDQVHAGRNEMRIEVWSIKQLPDDALAPEAGPDRLLFPFGVENIVGRVGIGGDVYIESRPKLRIDDIQIIPDLKKNADHGDDELKLLVTVVNNTGHDRELDVKAKVSSWGSDSVALRLPQTRIQVGAYSSEVVSMKALWPDAHYWSRADPFLYVCRVSLECNGEQLHENEDRFGFREFYRVGDKYYCNGVKIRLRGDSLCLLNQGNRDLINEVGDAYGVILDDNHATDAMVVAWIDAYKHANANILRNHIRSVPSPVIYNHADEVGMLLEEETAFWNPGSVSNVSLDPPYYLNYSDESISYYCEWVARWVRSCRNHPSIVLWSTTNEAWNPNDALALIPPLEKTVLENDPTRMVINDGFNKPITNEDSRHYYGGYPSGMTSAEDIYNLYDIDSDLPLGAGEEFSVSTAGIPQYDDEGGIKDIYHGRLNGNPDTISRADFGREIGRVTRGIRTTRMMNWKPFCWSMFVYDNIEKNIKLDQTETHHGLNPKMLMRPQFDVTAQGDARWVEGDGFEYFANSFADVAAFDKGLDKEPRLGRAHDIYRPGSTSKRTILVYNDEEVDGVKLDLCWTVSAFNTQDADSIICAEGHHELQVGHGEFVEDSVEVQVPAASCYQGHKLLLTLKVFKQGKLKYDEANFLGWIGHPAPARLSSSHTRIDLGRVDWNSRSVKHCIHLRQDGGALSERWVADLADDAKGAISLERLEGNLRHEQEEFFTVNVAGLESGRQYTGEVVYRGLNGDSVTIEILFVAGSMPEGKESLNLAAGAKVSVSSASTRPGWTTAKLVDGNFKSEYDCFGYSSRHDKTDHQEWVQLEFHVPVSLAQVVLVPRGENPGGTVAEAFHGDGNGVGGVQEFAAGHKALDPNIGEGFPKDFTIEVSRDGSHWHTVVERHDYPVPVNGKARAFDFEKVDGVRFLKLDVTSLHPNEHENGEFALQLAQLAAYGSAYMPTVPGAPMEVSVCVQGHDVEVGWSSAFDGRSALTGTSLTLRNSSGEIIPVEVAGSSSKTTISNVPDGMWSLSVRSRNALGIGEPSELLHFNVGKVPRTCCADVEPPSPEVELLSETESVKISWREGASDVHGVGCKGVNIHLVPQSSLLDKRVAWSAPEAGSFIFANVRKGTYRAVIEQEFGDDEISLSSFPSASVLVACAPEKPNKPSVTSDGDTATINWQPPVDGGAAIVSFVLTLRNLTENTSKVSKVSGDWSSTKISGLAPGNYTVSVIAVNSIGMSPESSPSLPCLIK
jgi:hypothetical protein